MAIPPESKNASAIVRQLLGEREALTADVIEDILRGIPEFARDARLANLLEAAATENVSTLIHAIALDMELDSINASAASLEHARILAQREVPITVLLRAYRLGQSRFIEGIIERARVRSIDTGDVALEIVHSTSLYIDRISDQVAQAYEVERELRLGSAVAVRQHWVNKLLTSTTNDVARAEGALRYRLSGSHVAALVWIDGDPDAASGVGLLNRAAAVLTQLIVTRGEILSVPTDPTSLRLWFPVPESFVADSTAIAAALAEAKLAVRVAIGDRREGIDGFRSSAVTAAKVKSLARGAGRRAPAVVAYADVVPVVLITDDEREREQFVTATLGELAMSDPRRDDLRETLLTYLECNRSHHAAAVKLHVHRNTVHYRVQQAVEQFGLDLDGNAFAIQFALTICRWQARF